MRFVAVLGGHKDLGVHTEMFSDGVLPLIESGVINNARKSTYRGRTISAFLSGRGAFVKWPFHAFSMPF